MTIDELRNYPDFAEGWPKVYVPLIIFLTDRLLTKAVSSECTAETAQRESARQKELAQLIRDLQSVGQRSAEPPPAPRMKPLHSMGTLHDPKND